METLQTLGGSSGSNEQKSPQNGRETRMKRDVTYCRTFLETMKREGFWIKRIKSEVYKKKTHVLVVLVFGLCTDQKPAGF